MRAAALALVAFVAAAAPPVAPTHRVEDNAAFLTPATRSALDTKLSAYERATRHQLVVWIDRTLGGAPIDEWAVKTFETWKLGRKDFDDGLAMFIFADDRAIAIEVGYGLEDHVPDAIASRIIREVMTPRLQAGDRDGAVVAGVDAVLAAIEGRPWTAPAATATGDESPSLPWPVYAILAVIALLVFIKYPRAAMWLFWSLVTAGRWSGGGSHGGARGGGGRSGGGGARGHW
jgi:uncharacterized protein